MEDPNLVRQYKPVLIQFMSFIHQVDYGKDHVFSVDDLSTIQPTDIVRWLTFKAWGTDDPEPGAPPQGARANTLLTYKKSLSYFMPQQTVDWNPTAEFGNPTRSKEVRAIIKFVKKKEVRNQGADSQTRRPLVAAEFRQTVEMLLNSHNDSRKQYMMSAAIKMQFHLIGRIDDTCHMTWAELKRNPHFNFTLLVRMRWSKNVLEERDAPDQIVMGAKDPMYCVLFGLGLYGEVCSETGLIQENNVFLFGHTGDANRNKAFISSTLNAVWGMDQFERQGDEPIGSHSIRKFATTKARQSGCSRDDVEDRARWRRQTRISTRYTDVRLPYPDARVAAALCVGGPIKYAVRNGAPVTRAWVFQFVIPNFVRTKGGQLSDDVLWNLGLALMWGCFDDSAKDYIPDQLVDRVKTNWVAVQGADGAVNPIVRIDLAVTGQESELHIAEIIADGEELAEGGGGTGVGGWGYEHFRILYSTLHNVRREILETQFLHRNELGRELHHLGERVRILQQITRRQAMIPFRRNRAANVEQVGEEEHGEPLAQIDPRARLAAHPKTLYDMWNEWEQGLGGNKAAKLFSATERGRCKHSYCRRKLVWEILARLVRAGYTPQVACDTVYGVYGQNMSVTRIIQGIKDDKRNGVQRAELQV